MVESQYREAAVERAMKVQEVIIAGDGQADYLVAGGRDSWSESTNDSPNETEVEEARIRWLIRSPLEASKSETSAGETIGESVGALSREVFRF